MITLLSACFVFLLGYLSGSIPYGLLIAKYFYHIDPRQAGSKNIGSTNIARLCGKGCGVATLLCDVLKGFFPVFFIIHSNFFWLLGADILYLAIVCGAGSIIGHLFPVWLSFKGGKGVATSIGVFLVLAPFELLLSVALCLLTIYKTGFVSAGSLVLSICLPTILLIQGEYSIAAFSSVISCGIIWAHKENIKRILAGTEKSWIKGKENEKAE